MVYNKSDLAGKIISTQQAVPPFAEPQEGMLNNGAGYKLSESDGQHLIVWRGLSVLEVDYSGAASLAEHLELYASTID